MVEAIKVSWSCKIGMDNIDFENFIDRNWILNDDRRFKIKLKWIWLTYFGRLCTSQSKLCLRPIKLSMILHYSGGFVCLIKHSCTQASFINYKICNGMQRHKIKVSVVHDIHVVRRIQGLM